MTGVCKRFMVGKPASLPVASMPRHHIAIQFGSIEQQAGTLAVLNEMRSSAPYSSVSAFSLSPPMRSAFSFERRIRDDSRCTGLGTPLHEEALSVRVWEMGVWSWMASGG